MPAGGVFNPPKFMRPEYPYRNFTHRLLAWGVLGLATGGRLVSLLTLLFSGAVDLGNPGPAGKFRAGLELCFSVGFLTRNYGTSSF